MIKGLLLDYGGTIDTNGMHWGELFWKMYRRHGITVTKEAFREAYVFGEKALALHPFIQPQHRFPDVLRIKLGQQFGYLQTHGYLSPEQEHQQQREAIAADCDGYVSDCIAEARPVLESLAARFPLVLVSNFYGNINAVLEGYDIRHFFSGIIESATAGVRKPAAQIFSMGAEALCLSPEECAVIGDSYHKDIEPGKAAGCYTVWLKGEGWEEDPDPATAADRIIKSFSELRFLTAPAFDSGRM